MEQERPILGVVCSASGKSLSLYIIGELLLFCKDSLTLPDNRGEGDNYPTKHKLTSQSPIHRSTRHFPFEDDWAQNEVE